MSDLKRGEELVIFLAVGFVLFVLVALGAVLYECINVHSSKITKHKEKKQWKVRRLSLCNPRPSLTGETARAYLPSDNLSNTDEQDIDLPITNNDTLPHSADQIQVVFTEVHVESTDT